MGKKYKAVYADPPWAYKVYSKKGEGRSAENHYHTMDIEEIRSLPVESIADDDCILFLWVTFPCLLEGLSVMKSWGFAYKTCPRIELFARRRHEGWDCLGNEIDGKDIRDAIREVAGYGG